MARGRAGGDGVGGAGLAGSAELHPGRVAARLPGRGGHLFPDGLYGLPHLIQILFCHKAQPSSVYFARSPPMSFGRVRAQRIFASPIFERLSRTGTATRRRCIPMRVPPMSIPAWARISSTAMGSRNCFQQVVAQLPPAWGGGARRRPPPSRIFRRPPARG